MMKVTIQPQSDLQALDLTIRGQLHGRAARVLIANLPQSIAQRELAILREKLSWDPQCLQVEAVSSPGPGNVVFLELESDRLTEVFTGFGERGVRAEAVAEQVIVESRRYLTSSAAVGEHLADQLLLPLALTKGGVFTTLSLTPHTRTNIDTIGQFLAAKIRVHAEHSATCTIEVAV
jgi:RNA 3'-terminal phosphate cyclase (ATP)